MLIAVETVVAVAEVVDAAVDDDEAAAPATVEAAVDAAVVEADEEEFRWLLLESRPGVDPRDSLP